MPGAALVLGLDVERDPPGAMTIPVGAGKNQADLRERM